MFKCNKYIIGSQGKEIDKLIKILNKYFNIGDSYVYNLNKHKEAYTYGGIILDDFTEFTETNTKELAEFIFENMYKEREIDKLIDVLYVYFNIGDSYVYNLNIHKDAYYYGYMTLDDFTEFTDTDIVELAEFIFENMCNKVMKVR